MSIGFYWMVLEEKMAGGRIRTCASRDQNPLPYRLATPQQRCLVAAKLSITVNDVN